MANSTKTKKLGIHREVNAGKVQAVLQTQDIFNQVIEFYQTFLVDHLLILDQTKEVKKKNKKTGEKEIVIKNWENKDILSELEKHTWKTNGNPHPIRPLTESIPETQKMYQDLRRAAINKAIGRVRSWRSNHQNWLALEPSKRKGEPQLGQPNEPITFYTSQYDLNIQETKIFDFVALNLYSEEKWQKVEFPVHVFSEAKKMIEASLVEKNRIKEVREEAKKLFPKLEASEYPQEWKEKLKFRNGIWEMESPTLYVYRDKRGKSSSHGLRLSLNVPFKMSFTAPKKAETQRKENPSMAVTTVDLGVNNLAAMINWKNHHVQETYFISGAELNHRRKHYLNLIYNARSLSGKLQKGIQDNEALWRKVTNINDDAAWQVARRIVEFAKDNQSSVIVFEFLRSYQAPKGRMSRSGRRSHKQAYFLRGKIMDRVREIAYREGILVVERNPAYTSQTCPTCSTIGERSKHSFVCKEETCGWKGNADFVGAFNLYWKWQRTFKYTKRAS